MGVLEKINPSRSVKKLNRAMDSWRARGVDSVYYDSVSNAIVSAPSAITVTKVVEKEIDKVALRKKLIDIDGISSRLANEVLALL